MQRQNNRREFLKTTAVAGVGFWAAGSAMAEESKSANEKINFACIGVDGKGKSDTADAGKHGEVVAICDIDDRKLEAAAAAYPNAKKYHDFRELLDAMGDKIDAVTVSTPDHTHAPAAAMAMKKGKHCFCQKPLTHSIYEARRLAEIAREMKVATQMGNQGTAADSLRRAASQLKAGAVGPVKEVHVWTNRPIWPQGGGRPPETSAPDHIHWDLWLGPAKHRPYANGYHPFAWRGWWDFGTGALGDMACHTLNMPFMALDLSNPTSVEAKTSGHNKESYPGWSVITYEFPATSRRPAVKLVWYDGGKRPEKELLDGKELEASGCLVIGEAGKLYAPGDYAEKQVYLLGGAEDKKPEFPRSPGHFDEFVGAIKGGEQAMSNFPDYAGPLTETVLLGNLAVWADGKKIEWDAKELKATNAPEVDHIIKHEYREGYTL